MSNFQHSLFQRKPVLAVLLCLIFLSFFGTLAVSARMFPQNYDWRYRVISNLLSPRDNPSHHWLAASGVALAALFTLPFAFYLRRTLETVSPRTARLSAFAFLIGLIALICDCFVAPQHVHAVLGIRRLHECLARSAAGLIALGMLGSCWCAWKGRGRDIPAKVFWIWSLLTLVPLIGLCSSEFLLLLTKFEPVWAAPIRQTLRHSVFWHLGFWEWIGAVTVFLFLCTTLLLTPPVETGGLGK